MFNDDGPRNPYHELLGMIAIAVVVLVVVGLLVDWLWG